MFDFSIEYLKMIPIENKNRIIGVIDNLKVYAKSSLNAIKKLENWYYGKDEDLLPF